VNTFCPRLFSAIRLPDGVLASRTIVTPLIRTIDRHRANADPLDYKLWPHDRRRLIDDLWALALAHLSTQPRYGSLVNDNAALSGRNLEPWRAILAVAKWLQDNGVKGLWDRMHDLSQKYQQERPEMESSDLTALVIRALCHCAITAMSAVDIVTPSKFWILKTEDIMAAAKTIVQESELDLDSEKVTSRRVGRVLGQMRLTKEPRPGGKGSRLWHVSLADLHRWTTLYSIPSRFG
jgi:hypothetical protein